MPDRESKPPPPPPPPKKKKKKKCFSKGQSFLQDSDKAFRVEHI